MEWMILRRLLWFFSTTDHLLPHLTGFLPGHSVHHGHLLLEHDIRSGFNRRAHTLACFLDLEKAFDSVWHQGLLLKCRRLGLPLCFIKWLNSFLSHRTSQLRICNNLSNPYHVPNGTPQGSVLSPLLFNIMLSDLSDSLPPGVSVTIYADDICLWNTGTNLPLLACHLQGALDSLELWANSWGFQFSAPKSTTMLFTRRRIADHLPCLLIGNSTIPYSNSHRFLGIIFDKRLTWHSHLLHLQSVCSKRLHLLRFICGHSWGTDRATMLRLVTTLIRPHLEFGAPLFLHASRSFLHGLEVIQAKSLRLATGLMHSVPHLALQVETGIEPIPMRLHRLSIRLLLRTVILSPHSPLATLFTSYLTLGQTSWHSLPPAIVFCANLIRPALPTIPHLPSPLTTPSWLFHPVTILFPDIPSRSFLDTTAIRALFMDSISPIFDSSLHIFTDGAFDPATGLSSSSIFIPSSDTALSFSLPLHTGIFCSEQFALLTALRHLDTIPPTPVVIFSDSRSALMSLLSCHTSPSDPLLTDILLLHHSLLCQGFIITFHWVPAHCGIVGNETADRLAASPQLQTDYIFPPNCRLITSCIIGPLQTNWQNDWDTATTARHLHSIKPTVECWSHFNDGPRSITTLLGRLRTGHSTLHASLHRHGVNVAPTCRFCNSMETVEHILLDCTHLASYRHQFLTPLLSDRPQNIPPLVFLLSGGMPPFPHYRTLYTAIHDFFRACRLTG